MISNLSAAGVLVPDGFATTADAYRSFIGDTGLADSISAELAGWTLMMYSGWPRLAAESGRRSLTNRSRPTWRTTSATRTTGWLGRR